MADILHRVWQFSIHTKVYMHRKTLSQDLDELIEDYKKLDQEVMRGRKEPSVQ